MSARTQADPKGLVIGVLVMTLLVLGLGGAIIAIKLRPQPLPENAVDRAIEGWKRAVEQNPEDPNSHTGLGLAYLQAQRPDQAAGAFEDAIALTDGAWMAEFQLGVLVTDADPERALVLLKGAAKDAPEGERAAIYIAAGDLLLGSGEAKQAVSAFKRSLVFNPFTIEGHSGLAAAYEELGNEAAALKEYKQAAKFDPNNAELAEAIDRLGG